MTLRTRNGAALDFDAYFPDEAGLVYISPPKTGAYLNKYTRIYAKTGPRVVEITQADAVARKLDPGDATQFDHLQSGTIVVELPNPLDASANPTVRFPERNIPVSARHYESVYTAFVPPRIRAEIGEAITKGLKVDPVNVVLFFGTGTELGRHGLRSFIDRSSRRMIINVPGVEPQWDFAKGNRWGIGIKDDQIASIVKQCFGKEIPYVVDRLAGFSTGYIGVAGTIRNGLIALRDVQVLALFDCNYAEPRVKSAIAALKAATAGRVRTIAYASSVAGTPDGAKRRIELDISSGGTAWLFQRRDFQALTHARMLASGLADKTVDPSEIAASLMPALKTLFSKLPPRGSVVTEPSIHVLINGKGPPSGSITLDDWYKANKTDADLFLAALWKKTGTSPELVRLIWKHQLPGWNGAVGSAVVDTVPATRFTEGAHDFVPFEFAWEVLS